MALQDHNELATLRQQLEARAAELRGEVAALRAEDASDMTRTPGGPVEDDAERGEEEARHTVRHAEQGRDTQELNDIGAALDRMDAGSYGECIDCGCDIPPARLQAQPAAARCTSCQERAERG
ncbi:MAG: TraR/DksA family transcriptional regulator [Rubrivivax sp.]|nr:MAG: TraR/DksA family transcriptional regulator [Rubrivivax sp.]